ncbi:MAG: SEL1-like repeat protein [Rhizobiales bacterium]|nr:SEL1-like repeat protein [Hyphomicrobiales bacterium]
MPAVDPAGADLADRPPRELGMLYAAGRVVPRDLVAAHMWLNIAALKGDREAARQRQEIAGEMSKDEIARALAGARAWLDRQAQSAIV